MQKKQKWHRAPMEPNVTFVKKLGTWYKIATMKWTRFPDWVDECPHKKQCRTQFDAERLDNNIVRAKTTIREIALANEWDWFVTLTLGGEKQDREDLRGFIRDLNKFIANYNRYCEERERVRFLFVPELHKKGGWHMHGLVRGIRMKDIVKNANGYNEWRQYAERFGYMSMGKIKSHERVSLYIAKYVTKQMASRNIEVGAHMYYCSQGLNRGERVYRGQAKIGRVDFVHPSGVCKITWAKDDNELAELFAPDYNGTSEPRGALVGVPLKAETSEQSAPYAAEWQRRERPEELPEQMKLEAIDNCESN